MEKEKLQNSRDINQEAWCAINVHVVKMLREVKWSLHNQLHHFKSKFSLSHYPVLWCHKQQCCLNSHSFHSKSQFVVHLQLWEEIKNPSPHRIPISPPRPHFFTCLHGFSSHAPRDHKHSSSFPSSNTHLTLSVDLYLHSHPGDMVAFFQGQVSWCCTTWLDLLYMCVAFIHSCYGNALDLVST